MLALFWYKQQESNNDMLAGSIYNLMFIAAMFGEKAYTLIEEKISP